jgi:uncharacterized lipoprotein YajG
MKRIGLLGVACLLLAGCTTYYKVTDIETQKHYFTTGVQKKSSGAVSFKDSRTGSEVTLQSSEIRKVNKEEFEYGDK